VVVVPTVLVPFWLILHAIISSSFASAQAIGLISIAERWTSDISLAPRRTIVRA